MGRNKLLHKLLIVILVCAFIAPVCCLHHYSVYKASGSDLCERTLKFGFDKAEMLLITYDDRRVLIEDPDSVSLFSD